MANTNCLEGMACPECGSEGPFAIYCTSWLMVYDDGTEIDHEAGGPDWGEDSEIACAACPAVGKVRAFYTEEEEV